MSRLDPSGCIGAEAAGTQVAALCWRRKGDVTQVLLLTSRDTGRWVIPKGWPMAGRAAHDAAAREAWEEGGVEGDVGTGVLGVYAYMKLMSPTEVMPCLVTVYPLHVRRLAKKFPERAERRRAWVTVKEAQRRVVEPDLGALIAAFDPGPAPEAAKAKGPPEAAKAKGAPEAARAKGSPEAAKRKQAAKRAGKSRP